MKLIFTGNHTMMIPNECLTPTGLDFIKQTGSDKAYKLITQDLMKHLSDAKLGFPIITQYLHIDHFSLNNGQLDKMIKLFIKMRNTNPKLLEWISVLQLPIIAFQEGKGEETFRPAKKVARRKSSETPLAQVRGARVRRIGGTELPNNWMHSFEAAVQRRRYPVTALTDTDIAAIPTAAYSFWTAASGDPVNAASFTTTAPIIMGTAGDMPTHEGIDGESVAIDISTLTEVQIAALHAGISLSTVLSDF
jgi:hypothetical protein